MIIGGLEFLFTNFTFRLLARSMFTVVRDHFKQCFRSSSIITVSLVFLLLSDSVFSQDAEKPSHEPQSGTLRVLLITGGCGHDYQNQKKLIRDGLSKHVDHLEWTVLEYGTERDLKVDVYQRADWIKGYDLVIHNECYGGVEDADFVNGIVKGHVDFGVPAIVIHCSMHSYRNSPAADNWRSLLGVTSRRHEKGNRSLRVESTQEGNEFGFGEILGSGWDTPNGELYLIEEVWPQTVTLATAFSSETNRKEPVAWINQHKGVRVFGISLGHHNETIESEPWQKMLASGFTWATGDGS